MLATITAKFRIETDGDVPREQLVQDFQTYLEETQEFPHGNVFSHTTGQDLGEINIQDIEWVKGIRWTPDELQLLTQMVLITWDCQRMLGLDEYLGLEHKDKSHDFLIDVLTDVTTKLNIAAEQTWEGEG